MGDDSSIGTNLYWNVYYSTEFPFLNRMKSSSGWISQGSDSPIPLTADGYPTGYAPGGTGLYTMVGLDPVTSTSDNTYVLTYTGTATFFIAGGQIISSQPGKIVFNFTRTDTNQTFISVSGLDPSHPLDNMALVRSDQVDLYNNGEIFNPDFVSKVSQLGDLRFMDWNNTNLNNVQNWSDRTTVNDMTWQSAGNSSVPIEVEVALANEAKTDIWLNVPTQATDDYVRQMMTYVHNNLDPSLTVHLEYSNEVWNFSFQQAHYALTKGDQLWGVDANGDGVIDPNDPAEHVGNGWVMYYGYRAAQIANVANQVYGADASRLQNVLATQTAWEGLEDWIVDGVGRANVGTVSQLFSDYAVTTYFGGGLSGLNAADQATILSWATSGDTGVTAAIAALKDGTGLTDSFGSLSWLSGVLAYQGAEARKLGLNLVAYEGGLDLTQAANAFGANSAVISSFVDRIRADPRVGDLYTQMATDFSAAGGTLLNNYTDVGPGYGSLQSIYDDGSPEWDALVAAQKLAAAQNPVVTTPVVTTPVVTTPVVTTPVVTTPVVTTPVVTTPVVTTPVVTTPVVTTPVVTTPVVTTPVVTTPVVTTPVVTTPVVTTPVVTTPVVTTPVVTTPVVTTPVVTTPVVTTPVVTTPVVTTPVVTTPVVTTPVVTIPLATIPAAAHLASGTTDQVNYTLAGNETTISYVGTGMFTAVGNDLGDTLTAGDGGSSLTGGAGADTLIGGAGADYLDGGAGIDRMVGGAGNDTYIVDDYRDQVIEQPGGGIDTVRTALSAYVLPDQVENLTYIGLGSFQAMGNTLDNVITGGSGPNRLLGGDGNDTLIGGASDDVLDGGSGADRMIGGAGNDIYFVDNPGDQVVEDPNRGIDTVYSTIDYVLPDNVENLTLFGTATHGTGNALANVIVGNTAGDYLSGGAGNDTLIGGAGNDVLEGGPGADILTGGAGADRFVFRAGDLDADPAKSDIITDFSHTNGDKIDLSAFDANLPTAATGFTFIGAAAFSDHAGELRIDASAANQVIYGDINGDGIADFALTLSKGAGTLISTDFVL